jgi:KaiC/GvpD/RAD55 family RecA-like ATPase
MGNVPVIRVPTGIKGLDEMLGGGFPKGRAILICGAPGTGKTVFSLQFLASAAERGVHGIYVTLEEPINLVKENIESFAWNISEKEKNNSLKLINSTEMPYVHLFTQKNKRNEDPILLMTSKVADAAKSIGAEILVIDPLTCVTIHEQSATVKRGRIVELFNYLRSNGYTSILTSETVATGGEWYIEEYLADGIIRLDKVIHNFNLIRTIRIEKMRGVKHDEQPRRYVIDEKGLTVYNKEPIKM